MQRRAAAAYIVLFLVLAAGAYATLAAAHTPAVSFQDPDIESRNGGTFTVGDREYTVSEIKPSESDGGGHGGGNEATLEATFEWTNESARYTETWSRGDEVEYANENYILVLANTTDPDSFTLRERLSENVSTYEREGTTYVIVNDTGDRQESVPLSSYEAVERIDFTEGDSFTYLGNETTVQHVTNESVTVTWTHWRKNEVSAAHHGNVTLNGETYLAHFPNENQVQFTQDFESFEDQQQYIAAFEERMNGLRGIVILSAIAIVLLAALAFLPVRE